MLKYFIAFVGCLFSQLAFGQITTSAIKGQVKNEIQEMLSGASIQLTHEPTGVKYGAISREDGRFNLSNLRVGGPYRLEVSFVGFENRVIEGIVLKLGEEKDFNLVLTNAVIEIEDLVFIEGVEDFDRNKTGARQIIDNATLRKIPTISRSTADIYKLSPSASGNSFAGRNDQFNNFSLDGSIFNNPFGLDAAAPGGQANAQPISLDAIDQIQVSLAPYDVTMSGFTGASVNAVTKSGTNEVKGTVFGFYRNQDLTGKKVRGEEIFIPNLSQIQTGFSVGGPIIKDKLFYFANFELERREDLGSNFIASGSAGAAENIS